MADVAYRNEPVASVRGRTDWGAIWAGVFTAGAIWAVFGLLGMAIFKSAGGPAMPETETIAGTGVGMGIWAVVLTAIAMYVAGRETGRLAGVANRRDGVVHGMIMFGLTVVAALVVAVLGSNNLGNVAGIEHPFLLVAASNIGWYGFVALFLGWLGAMGGAFQSVAHKPSEAEVRDIRRPAA